MKKILFPCVGALLTISVILNVWFISKNNDSCTGKRPGQIKTTVAESSGDTFTKHAKKSVSPSPIFFCSASGSGKTITADTTAKGTIIADQRLKWSIRPDVKAKVSVDGKRISFTGDFQPGQEYLVSIDSGFTDSLDGISPKKMVFSVRIPDYEPTLEFLSSGTWFPAGNRRWGLPYMVRNVEHVNVTLYKAYENNLMSSYGSTSMMQKIGETEIRLKIPKNVSDSRILDIGKLMQKREYGVYRVVIDSPSVSGWSDHRTRDVVITDLAMQTIVDRKAERIAVFVRRFSNGGPAAGTVVEVWSDKRQKMVSGLCNSDGFVCLDYGADNKDKEQLPRYIRLQSGADYAVSILNGNTNVCSSSSPDVRTAFLFPDRGIVRPGESVDITLFLRNFQNGKIPPAADVPAELQLTDSTGGILAKQRIRTGKYGEASVSFHIPENTPSGLCTVSCGIAGKNSFEDWGTTSFRVGLFVPDRMKVTLSHAGGKSDFSSPQNLLCKADYYFGSPVESGKCVFQDRFHTADNPRSWDGWTAGDSEGTVLPAVVSSTVSLTGKPVEHTVKSFRDSGGMAFVPVSLSSSVQVTEDGGRTVTGSLVRKLYPSDRFIGLRETGGLPGGCRGIEWTLLPVTASLQRNPADLTVRFRLYKVHWEYTLVRESGRTRRCWKEIRKELPEFAVEKNIKAGTPLSGLLMKMKIGKELECGKYELVAESGKEMRTRLCFWHFEGEGGDRNVNPALLTFKMNADSFKPGETARIRFESTLDGIACCAAGCGSIEKLFTIPVRRGENSFELKIPSGTTSGSFFCGVTLVSGTNGNVSRGFGLLKLKVDQNRHKLKIDLASPVRAKPGEPIHVKIRIADQSGKPVPGAVRIYAVDEGVLALTRYRTPDIFSGFFGDAGHNLDFYDVYSSVYPELGIRPDGRIGGDGNASHGSLNLKVLKQKETARVILPLALIPDSGEKEFSLPLPDHTGSLRLMAVAVSGEHVGTADREIVLHEEMSCLLTSPRFAAPGDELELSFKIFNHESDHGNFTMSLQLPDGFLAEKQLFTGKIAKKKSCTLPVKVKCSGGNGPAVLRWTLTWQGGIKHYEEFITLRPVHLPRKESSAFVLAPGEKRIFVLSSDEWARDAKGTVKLLSSPVQLASSALDFLNQYPYGCLEQTVAAAFPFLFLQDLVKAGVLSMDQAETSMHKVNSAWTSIREMRLSSGAFSMWPGGKEPWISASLFAAHFLLEGRDRNLIRLSNGDEYKLKRFLRSVADSGETDRPLRAYAIYLLSSMDGFSPSAARNLLACTENDYASFLAGAALIRGGYSAEGADAVRSALAEHCWNKSALPEISTASSRIGMTLHILTKCGWRDTGILFDLSRQLASMIRADGSGWGTTQSNAWAAVGLASVSSLFPAGEPSGKFLAEQGRILKGKKAVFGFNGKSVTLENTGKVPLLVERIVSGTPLDVPKNSGKIVLRKEYLDQNGKPCRAISHGDLFYVRITADFPFSASNAVICDLLPAGVEIEDGNLAGRNTMLTVPPTPFFQVKTRENRSDRFMVCGNAEPGKSVFVYAVRASFRGRFAVPPCQAEVMYDPEATGVFNPGRILVIR